MIKTIGRNDPCPCGSGKKYKKCCGLTVVHGGFIQTPESWFPHSERTGTLWDDYMELIPIVAMYGKKVMDFEEDGKEFRKAVSDFEKQFRPGEERGITDSFFMSWQHFDLRFGKSLETVAERLLSDTMISQLNEPDPTYIRELSESYSTFYEVIDSSFETDIVTVRELGTGKSFTVFNVRELSGFELNPGDICFVRRVGSPDRSIFFTTPYVYDPETRAQFKRAVLTQEEDFKESPRAQFIPAVRHFAESQKEAALFWAWYILQGEKGEIPQIPDSVLFTTDGDAFVFTEVHFRIQDEAALRKRLSMLRSFQYDQVDDSWSWLTAKSRKYLDAPRSVLAHFTIQSDRLIAETNSKERAVKLRSKLKGHLGNLITYEKTLYRDINDVPEQSTEEIEAQEKASRELNARPEIQEVVKKNLEYHYFVKWPKMKVPALGGLSPLQAARRKKERVILEQLIDGIGRMQDPSKPGRPVIDIDRLRRILGLEKNSTE